jgi:hypothetical protein
LVPTTSSEVQVPKDKAKQLVDQFATLASRLGIDLPDSVLQSLTSAAAKNDPTLLGNNSNNSSSPGAAIAAAHAATNSSVAAHPTTPVKGRAALNTGKFASIVSATSRNLLEDDSKYVYHI